MSALGHKQTYAPQQAMSALHPIATAKADLRKTPCLLYPRKQTCAVQRGTLNFNQRYWLRLAVFPPPRIPREAAGHYSKAVAGADAAAFA